MHTLYLLSVWLHILGVAVWIGGMAFIALVMVPAIRRPEYQEEASALIHWIGVRFRAVGWVTLGLLFLTGLLNLTFRGFGFTELWNGQLFQGPFGRTLGIKLLLVALILLLSVLHDFRVGPKATAAWQANAGSHETKRLRRNASWIARVNLLLALVVVALGVMLVRGGF